MARPRAHGEASGGETEAERQRPSEDPAHWWRGQPDVLPPGGRVVADGDQRIEAVARRRRQMLGHALRQQGADLLAGTPHRAAQRRVGRGEDVFVAKPAPRPSQQRARAIEPQRFVLEEPRQPFSGGGVERDADGRYWPMRR